MRHVATLIYVVMLAGCGLSLGGGKAPVAPASTLYPCPGTTPPINCPTMPEDPPQSAGEADRRLELLEVIVRCQEEYKRVNEEAHVNCRTKILSD